MKRLFITATAILALVTAGVAQTPVDNGNLENWTTATGVNGNYEDLPGPFLKTLNSLYNLPAGLGGPGPLTTVKTTDVCEGTYAAKITSKGFLPAPNTIFIPGAMGTFDVSLAPPGAKLGKPYTSKPLSVKYCTKYTPVGGDSAEVFCLLSKWNGTSRDTIAYGHKLYYQSTDVYSQDGFALTYYDNVTAPDSATLLAVASAGYDFVVLTNSTGQINSTLYIDNLRFDFTTGVNETTADVAVKMYPSPATEVLNIWIDNTVGKTTYRIIDLAGRTVLTGNIAAKNNEVNIAGLAAGTYWVQVAGAKGPIATKQIQKQ